MSTLSKGIAKTSSGYLVRVSVGRRTENLRVSKRFPLTTKLSVMRAWQDDERPKLRKKQPLRAETGTLAADAQQYLTLVAAMPSIKDRTREIHDWVEVYGHVSREDITHVHVQSQLERWRLSRGWAANTLNHRKTALSHLYTTLDGREARNPCRAVKKYDEPDAMPRAVGYAIIWRTLHAMRESPTKWRCEVFAHSPLSPAELTRLERRDFDPKRRTVVARARRKGKGTEPRVIPLTDAAVEALRKIVQLRELTRKGHKVMVDASGAFSMASLRKSWRLAWTKGRQALIARWTQAFGDKGRDRALLLWPEKPSRPYDLRHSFLTVFYQETGDIRATGALGGHSPKSAHRTTFRYTLAAVSPRLQQGIAEVNKILVGSRRWSGNDKSRSKSI